MAQKTKKSNQFKKKPSAPRRKPRPWKNPLKDRRLHLAVGFFLIVAALYLLIAFVSFLFNGLADQSVVASVLTSDVKSAGLEIKNWLGLVGATAAYLFIFRWFGVASFLIPPLLLVWGTRIVFRQRMVSPHRAFQWVAFFLVWTSLLLGYAVYRQAAVAEWGFLGGGLGYEMAVLSSSLIGWGTFLLLLLALAVFLVFFFDIAHWFNFTAPPATAPAAADPPPSEASFAELMEEVDTTPEPSSPFDQEEAGVEIIPPPEPAPPKTAASHIPLNVAPPPPAEQLSLEIEEPGAEEESGTDIEHYDPTLDLSSYRYPAQGLLDAGQSGQVEVDPHELEANKDRIVETLINFKIGISFDQGHHRPHRNALRNCARGRG